MSCGSDDRKERTLGQHIATRLVEIGVRDFFTVPGDFNLVLLDQLLKEPRLRMVNCCNELNAGYAADGYARARGVGVCVVTFTVGGLSVINAIAGAYSEYLPVICIVGGPNSNDYGSSRILHHTIGLKDFQQEFRCFQQVTAEQVVIRDLEDAYEQIDHAISSCLLLKRPVYLSVSCNLAGIPHPTFRCPPVEYSLFRKTSNQQCLKAAVAAAAEFLKKAVKPVLVAGPKLRSSTAQEAFVALMNASEYATAMMPSAKGMVPETHERFIGTFWGNVSSPYACEIVESADAYLFAGPIFNDYSSVGYSLLLSNKKMILVHPDRVNIGGSATFGCVLMKDFLLSLAEAITPNPTAHVNYSRIYIAPGEPPKAPPNSPLRTNVLFHQVQRMLTGDNAVIAETGDSWFNCQKLKLPDGCGYEFQMQYGSIGWAVGATLGYATGATSKRVVAFIGDGSFQVTTQDVSTMIRFGVNPIIFLINNKGYTIEVEIHDGPYNNIKNWDYTALVEAYSAGEGNVWTAKIRTEEDLLAALKTAMEEKTDHLCFLEVITHRDDCSKELLEWGSRVSAANSRPPNPQ